MASAWTLDCAAVISGALWRLSIGRRYSIDRLVVIHEVRSHSSSEQRKDLFLYRSGHARFSFVHVDIHFAANAELRQINSRLNRKTSLGKDFAILSIFSPFP